MTFHHGASTKRVKGGFRPIASAPTAIVAVIGTAPKGEVNKLILCKTPKDFAQFGENSKEHQKYTLPQTLAILSRYNAGTFYVVNVTTDGVTEDGNDEAIKTAIKGSLGEKPTGLSLIRQGFSLFGDDAKIIIVPKYCEDVAIAKAMETLAEQIKAIAYIDLPQSITTLADAIKARGEDGSNNSASNRVHLFFPQVTNGEEVESLATHAAGLRCKVDSEEGYWVSSSNHPLLGVSGMKVKLTARLDDEKSETNALNEKGITTVFNSFGTGFRLWGNRTAAYPSEQHITNFEVAIRTEDVVVESIIRASLPYIDRTIDKALADSLVESVATYLRSLPSVIGSSVGLDYGADLVAEFSKGHVPIVYDYTPALPAEHISYRATMTNKYLINLLSK